MNPKPDKTIPAIYGGLIMGLISAIPFLNVVNCLCCAGVLLGGFFAVFFYKNEFTPDTPTFTSGDCMAVGALAGVVGAIVGTTLSMLILMTFGNITQQFILDLLRNMNLNLPEDMWDKIEESMMESFTLLKVMISFISSMILDTLFGLLGGLIGYSVYKPKQQMMPPPPAPTPQAP